VLVICAEIRDLFLPRLGSQGFFFFFYVSLASWWVALVVFFSYLDLHLGRDTSLTARFQRCVSLFLPLSLGRAWSGVLSPPVFETFSHGPFLLLSAPNSYFLSDWRGPLSRRAGSPIVCLLRSDPLMGCLSRTFSPVPCPCAITLGIFSSLQF